MSLAALILMSFGAIAAGWLKIANALPEKKDDAVIEHATTMNRLRRNCLVNFIKNLQLINIKSVLDERFVYQVFFVV